jgi:hypothetical protein
VQGVEDAIRDVEVCADGAPPDSTGTCPAQPQDTPAGTEAPQEASPSALSDHGTDERARSDETEKTRTDGLRDAVDPTAATVPLVVTITVPFPNMEPFLGSVENYAVWDSRVFLLAGLYTIVRVLYLVRKYVFGMGAAGAGAPAGGGN